MCVCIIPAIYSYILNMCELFSNLVNCKLRRSSFLGLVTVTRRSNLVFHQNKGSHTLYSPMASAEILRLLLLCSRRFWTPVLYIYSQMCRILCMHSNYTTTPFLYYISKLKLKTVTKNFFLIVLQLTGS